MIKTILNLSICVLISLTTLACSSIQQQSAKSLEIQVYNPQEKSIFPVTSTLISGPTEAILIDAQFQKNDAQKLVNMIHKSGKKLTTIYISHSDPDFYFGLDVIQGAFPDARILATPSTVKKMSESMMGKKKYWGPILKENAPEKLITPQLLQSEFLFVDGQSIQIMGLNGHNPDHTFAWIESEKTVLGGVVLSENMHLWMADNKTTASRDSWIKTLDDMLALKPERVIPGHFINQSKENISIIRFNKMYIERFENANNKSKNAEELSKIMKDSYPVDFDTDVLDFSAKVVKGDIQWPQ